MRSFVLPLTLLLGTTLVVGLIARELSRAWFVLGPQPELIEELELSLVDQRQLARLAPETAEARRQRFERTRALAKHLRVIALSRERLAERHVALLLGAALTVIVAGGGLHALRQSRRDKRLGRLQTALLQLADGTPEVRVEVAGRDVIGRVARMVEQVSAIQTRDRRRLASLEDLSRWQDAARRHAHEMRTPLAAAQLDLAALQEVGARVDSPEQRDRLHQLTRDIEGDVRRLNEFAQAFAAFGRLPQPRLVEGDLRCLVREFAERFSSAWPSLVIDAQVPEQRCVASYDAELLRQVLVNLCENSAAALREAERQQGTVHLVLRRLDSRATLDVVDEGPGVPAPARARLFQPYATFRPGGTGLGLAISRKILLDHGGDLELLPTERGAAFRLSLPVSSQESRA
jgi:two-component system, NtrC family, nitrogen regulation sensor histidine kinase NtrY